MNQWIIFYTHDIDYNLRQAVPRHAFLHIAWASQKSIALISSSILFLFWLYTECHYLSMHLFLFLFFSRFHLHVQRLRHERLKEVNQVRLMHRHHLQRYTILNLRKLLLIRQWIDVKCVRVNQRCEATWNDAKMHFMDIRMMRRVV